MEPGSSFWGDKSSGFELWCPKRHTSWKRERQLVYDAMRDMRVPYSRVRNFAQCGAGGWVLHRKDKPDEYAVVPKYCHDRFCRPCSRQRAWLIRRNLSSHLPEHPCRFVTLTLKSGAEPLDVLLDRLRQSFTKLRKHPFWQHHVKGGIAFLEVKWSTRGLRWHPHLHIICHGVYIPKYKLSEVWKTITTDSCIVDVTLIRGTDNVLNYVTKYATKTMDSDTLHDRGRLAECVFAMKGRKLCGAFGDWTRLRLLQPDGDGDWELLCSLDGLAALCRRGDEHALLVERYILGAQHMPVEYRYSALPPPEIYVAGLWQRERDYAAFTLDNGHATDTADRRDS